MSWIDKIKSKASIKKDSANTDLWAECLGCNGNIYIADLEKNLRVCPQCDYHFRTSAKQRINQLLEEGTFIEHDNNLIATDPLKFKDQKKYKDRYIEAQKKTKEKDALVVKKGLLKGMPIVAAAFDFNFMGGSMGSVVGEKFVRAADAAIENIIPLVCFSASGGARMQEGLFSLMQMSKTSLAVKLMADKQIPYISVLTDPTMGGVSASLAMLGDIQIAEPNARIGFAGARVVEQTVNEKLPEGFQRSEFLLEKGAIDMIVHRSELRNKIFQILSALNYK